MATKKQAAMSALGMAWNLHRDYAGDEEMDLLAMQLLWLADSLDPAIMGHRLYEKIALSERKPSRLTKLRNLILHPGTPTPEREAAVQALDKLRRREDS